MLYLLDYKLICCIQDLLCTEYHLIIESTFSFAWSTIVSSSQYLDWSSLLWRTYKRAFLWQWLPQIVMDQLSSMSSTSITYYQLESEDLVCNPGAYNLIRFQKCPEVFLISNQTSKDKGWRDESPDEANPAPSIGSLDKLVYCMLL